MNYSKRNMKKVLVFVGAFLTQFGLLAQTAKVEFVLLNLDEISTVSMRYTQGLLEMDTYDRGIGYMDGSGEFAIAPQFFDGGNFYEGLAWVEKIIDTTSYESRYGYINKQGEVVIPFQFQEAKNFSCGRAAVKKDGKWGYINKKGEMVLDSSYVWHYRIGEHGIAYAEPKAFYNGLLLTNKKDLLGYVDINGKTVIPHKFHNAWDFSDGVAIVAMGVKRTEKSTNKYIKRTTLEKIYDNLPGEPALVYVAIDTTGKVLFTIDEDVHVEPFSNGLAAFRSENLDYSWGFLNKKGEVVVPAIYSRKPFSFSEGIAIAQVNGKRDDNKDGYMVTLDTHGKIIAKIPFTDTLGRTIYDSKRAYHEGLLAVKVAGGNLKDAQWGYMDKYGKYVIEPQFDIVGNFSNGRAVVRTNDGKLAVIKNPLTK